MGKGERRGTHPIVDHPSVMWPGTLPKQPSGSQHGNTSHSLSSVAVHLEDQPARSGQGVQPRPEGISKELRSSANWITHLLSASHGILKGSAGVHWDPGLAVALGFVRLPHPCFLISSRFSERTGQRPPHQHLPLFCPQFL